MTTDTVALVDLDDFDLIVVTTALTRLARVIAEQDRKKAARFVLDVAVAAGDEQQRRRQLFDAIEADMGGDGPCTGTP
ncbi:MAG: hypothetical protein U0P45_17195 [Acidimicrobiales bacterium]